MFIDITAESSNKIYSDNLPNVDSYQAALEARAEAQKWCLGLSLDETIGMSRGEFVEQDPSLAKIIPGAKASSPVVLNNSEVNTGKLKSDSRFSPGFLEALYNLTSKLNIKFQDLLVAMSFETGGTFSPSKVNSKSGATGLIQFMPNIARGLGTTTTELAKMTQVQQLVYVEKYLQSKNLNGRDFSDIYMSILFPAAVGKSNDFVLFGKGAINSLFATRGYTQNKGLDLNKNGSITKYEAAAQAWDRGVKNLKGIISSKPTTNNSEIYNGRTYRNWSEKYG